MANDSPRKKLREEATCFICWDYYIDPLLLDCGHSFCRKCIAQCWREFPSYATCPQCSTTVERKRCRPNGLLANVVEIAKQLNSQAKEEGAEGAEGEGTGTGPICEKHPEPFQDLFCQEDQVAFCLGCDATGQHRDHCVVSVEDVAQNYKEFFSSYIEMLKKERAEIMKVKLRVVGKCDKLLENIHREGLMIAASFKKLHDFLVYYEHYLTVRVQPVTDMISRKQSDDLAKISVDILALDNTIRQLEAKCSQPVHEFLQGVDQITARCHRREKFQGPEDFPYNFRWTLWDLLDINALMGGLANYFTDTVQNACSLQRADVTFDEDSNHPQLFLSPDGKSMKWMHTVQRLPGSHKRFEKHFCVVGRQELTIGRYYWDILVAGQEEWAVGVAKSSVRRKGLFSLSVTEGIFAVGKVAGVYRVMDAPHCPHVQVNKELRRMRVSLNCSAGQISFYDLERATKIFGFADIGCFHETFLPFFWLNGRSRLSIILPPPTVIGKPKSKTHCVVLLTEANVTLKQNHEYPRWLTRLLEQNPLRNESTTYSVFN